MAINLANNNSLANITALPSSISGGAMTLISEQTASSSSTISFTSGIDSTYDEYVFKFYDIHPASNADFTVNFRDGGTNYDATKTTTFFHAQSNEAGNYSDLAYQAGNDVAQGTGSATVARKIGTGNDESCSGELTLFNPSSTTFVKHFISTIQNLRDSDRSQESFVGGYINTTNAIDQISFKFTSGNIDSGVIKLYGVS